jgi:hypothetical protein
MAATTFRCGKPGSDKSLLPVRGFRKGCPEGEHPAKRCLVPDLPIALMIPILFPASCVAPDGLNVAVRGGANPDVLPGRWDRQRLDSLQGGFVVHRFVSPEVAKTFAPAFSKNARSFARQRSGGWLPRRKPEHRLGSKEYYAFRTWDTRNTRNVSESLFENRPH